VPGILASVVASAVGWGITIVLEGHVSDTTNLIVGFVISSIVFVPSFVWIKRMRDGG
jgi:uncharacterized membrane protein YeiB